MKKGLFKALSLLMASAMLAGLLAGCGSSKTDTSAKSASASAAETGNCTVSKDANITMLNYADVGSLFPADMGAIVEFVPASLLYESLVAFDENMNLKWVLATSCDISKDSKTYTFHLRKGIKFSDGEKWNAEACKKNLDTITNDKYGFKDVSRLQVIESTTAVDEYTVKVQLSQAYAPFMNAMARFNGFVSPKVIDKGQSYWNTHAVGTGQYTLESYHSGEALKLKLNRNYWGYDAKLCGGKANLASNIGFNTITIKPVSEEATRVSMLMSGEANIINSISPTNIETVKKSGNTVVTHPGIMISYLNFNCAKTPLKDVRVRKAITMAINVEELNKVVYGGANTPADSVSAPSIKYYEKQTRYPYDVDAAKKLLADAGYANGLTLKAWEENDTSDIQRGEFISQQLAKVGITLKVYPMEAGALATDVHGYSGKPAEAGWDIYIRGYSAASMDPDEALGRYTTSQMPPKGNSNVNFYSNSKVDELCAEGAKTLDENKRAAIYKEVQEIMWKDLPLIPMLVNTYTTGCDKHVQGLGFLASGAYCWDKAHWVK